MDGLTELLWTASPPLPSAPDESFGTAAGRMEPRADKAGVTLRQADCMTRPHGSGPTRQSDAWDSEPTTCCCYRGTGRVFIIGVTVSLV